MNSADIKMLRIKKEVIRRYYVEMDGWIYGGPFDTKEEAKECINKATTRATSNLNRVATYTALD